MLPIIPILITAGGFVINAITNKELNKSLPQKDLVKTKENLPSDPITPLQDYFQDLFSKAFNSIVYWENRYQNFIQTKLDPKIIGQQRYQQMLELNGGHLRELSIPEKRMNRRLILGILALPLLSLTYLTSLPVLPIVLTIAIFNFFPLFKEGWNIAYKEHRLSLLHLLITYFSFMWLSGGYLIGTIAPIILTLNKKIVFLSQSVTRHNLTHLLGEQPQKVWVLVEGTEIEIPFENLFAGNILVLHGGQPLPVDGVIIKGSAMVDQHQLTGESQPVEKKIGDTVLASTLILNGHIQVKVEKTGEETSAAKIGLILNNTVEYQEAKISDQLRDIESTRWPMLAGGCIGWLIGGPITAVAILGCNFMTSLVPLQLLTLLNGLKAGAEQGVLIKDGRALNKISTIDTLVFDKTGTLTLNQPLVKNIHCTAGYNKSDVLTYAAAAEQRQSHPIAFAILEEAKNQQLELPIVEDSHYQLGLGLTVEINGKQISIGSEHFLAEADIFIPKNIRQVQLKANEQGNAMIFVTMEQQVIGAIELVSTLRSETKEVINWFKQQGLKIFILSGDQEAPTKSLATELDIDGYFSNTLPEQKAEHIKKLQEKGHKVCFIGDGINDAIALLQAEVSISLQGATTIAMDSAQIVLMDEHLKQLILLWKLADGFENSLATNRRLAHQLSLASVTGVILLPFKFWIVELLWGSQAITGVRIARKSLLKLESTKDKQN